MNRTVLSLIIAFLVAGLVTWLAYQLTSSNDKKPVLVSTRVIKQNQSLSGGAVRWDLRSQKDITPDLVTPSSNLALISTQSAKQDIPAGVPISTNFLQTPEKSVEHRLPTMLGPGKHGMLFQIPRDFAQRSILRSGDVVDILITHSVAPESREWVQGQVMSEVLLHNVKIILFKENITLPPEANKDESFFSKLNRIPQAPSGGGGAQGASVILEVTTKEAEILELAKSAGRMTILVSSANDDPATLNTHPYTTNRELGARNDANIQRYTIIRGARVQTIEVKRRD